MIRFLIYFTFLFANTSMAQSRNTANQFSFEGRVLGQDSSYVHLKYLDLNGNSIHDSCLLKKGFFQFGGIIDEPTKAYFYGNRKSNNPEDPNSILLFLEPRVMNVVFEVNDFKNGQITGSKTQAEYTIYNKQIETLKKKWKPMLDSLEQAHSVKDEKTIDQINNAQIPVYLKEHQRTSLYFIKQYPYSFVSASLLRTETQALPLDSLKAYFQLFSVAVKKSKNGRFINDFITNAESLFIGTKAPNFSSIDANGRKITLSDFRGKTVLIDFWASWCIPCRNEHPYLKQVHEKYKEKGFTIIGVSLDTEENKTKWVEAIAKDGLAWTQVCDFKGWEGQIVRLYNLVGKGIPANFLIDPSGNIIDKDLRGVQLEMKLSILLK